MIKSVIFDFDGLIIDTETAWYEVYKELLKELYEYDLPIEVFAQTVGSSGNQFWKSLSEQIKDSVDEHKVKEYGLQRHREKMEGITLRPGVIDYLNEAKEKQLKIALATSSSTSWVEGFMKKFDIYKYFDVITTKDHVVQTKPSPELYLKTLDKLSIYSNEAIVFEDSINGLIAANHAGIRTVIVPNPVTNHIHFKNYFMKINSMTDITLNEIIEKATLLNQT